MNTFFMNNFLTNYSLKGFTLNTTNQCNLRCTYCFEKNKHDLYMTKEDCKTILDKVTYNFEHRTLVEDSTSNFNVVFFGGEPTLNFEIMKYTVDYLKEKPYEVNYGITTNFVNITDEMLDFFYDNNVGILVSIDGLKELHDKNRCNSYDKVVENIKRALDKDLKLNLEARITLLPQDVKYLFESVKNIFSLGIDNIAPCVVYDVPWKDEDYIEFEKQIRMIYDWTLSLYNDPNNKRNLQVKSVNDFIELCLDYNNDNSPCGFGKENWISVGPDGEIAPCHQVHTSYKNYDELIVGNILKEELNTTRIRNIRNEIVRSKCFGCKFYHFCRGGCPIENMRLNGSYTTPSENTCRTNEIMYNITKDYQDKILNSDNIRSRRLNVLKVNLRLKKLAEDLRKDFSNANIMEKFNRLNTTLVELQKNIYANERIILPQYLESINKNIQYSFTKLTESFKDFMFKLSDECESMLKEQRKEKYLRRINFRKRRLK